MDYSGADCRLSGSRVSVYLLNSANRIARTTYLYKGIDVSHGWDVFRNEGFEASLEVDRLRRVPHDVREQLLYLLANIQVLVLGWVVGAFE